MTATNHALTGAVIGLAIASPLALPLAFLSHYILDMIPHYGSTLAQNILFKSTAFKRYLIAEAIICFLIVLMLFIAQPANWVLAASCAFLAAAPDLLSISRFKTVNDDKEFKPSFYSRFASGIQWFERPVGAAVEIVWGISAIFILANIL